MKMNYRKVAAVAVLTTVTLLSACQSIPTREFDDYLLQFQTARMAAEDVILKAKIRARAIADEPSNPDNAEVQAKKLKQRRAAMDARLDALKVVDKYNRLLTSLASGSSPEDIVTDLESFSDGLSNFNVASINDLVGSASPYLGVISQAVSLIDGYILAEQFGKVAAAGEKPVRGILKILSEDANNLEQIEEQWIGLTVTGPEESAVNNASRQIKKLSFKLKTDDDVTKAIKMANDHLNRWLVEAALRPMITDKDGVNDAGLSDIALLNLLANELGHRVDSYNAGLKRIKAYKTMIAEYKNVLGITSKALISLNRAIVTGRRTAAVDLAASVYLLRESYLALEEAQ